MIQVDDLSLSFQGVSLFEGVSFTVNSKERCGLVGRNGSGKTTLLKLITKEDQADRGVVTTPKGYRIGYLNQHIRFTEKTVLEEALLGLPLEQREDVYKAEAMLFGLGFKQEDLDTSPLLFSGGYQLRLHLAKVLLSDPDGLLLDEPTNYLDILSIRFLQRFLKQCDKEVILISHDREFMDSVTTHTLGLHRKKVKKYVGGTKELFNQIAQEEVLYEKTRESLEKKKAHLQSFVDRFGAKATKAAQAQSKKKMLDRLPALEQLQALYDLDFSFCEKPFYGKKMIEMKDVAFSYEETPVLIPSFSIEIAPKERVAIIGKNGRGKSTLLRLIASDLKIRSGFFRRFEGVEVGYFGQTHIARLDEKSTIEEEIASANHALNITEVKGICGKMMFTGDLSKKKIGVLSGGEKSRVLLGKILAKPCNLLLLDEPTHHLDVESIEALIDAIEEFEGAVVIVTHSELFLHRLQTDQLIVCHSHRQVPFQGTYAEFLEKVGWEEEGGVKKEKKIGIQNPHAQMSQLESDLRKLEKQIAKNEEEIRFTQVKLSQSSEQGDFVKCKELGSKLVNLEKALDSLYADFIRTEEEYNLIKSQ